MLAVGLVDKGNDNTLKLWDVATHRELQSFDTKSKQTPLILLTARTQEADRALGTEVGADVYLTKPFDPVRLLQEVQRLLGNRNSAGPGQA